MIKLSKDELAQMLEENELSHAIPQVNKWLERGDGVAVYENHDLGHDELGHKQFVSFGSPESQLETTEPPTMLPDIGGSINWRYQLVATYRGETL